jgi:hypothetical protein
MLASSLFRAALLSVAVVTSAFAQDSIVLVAGPPDHSNEFQRRSSGSVSLVQSRPTGAFSKNIGFGYGASGTYVFRLDNTGVFGLRAEGGILGYGDESFHAALSPTIGGRIQVKVSTTNYIVPLSIGPQIAWPHGVVRPYANAGIAAQIFFTQSDVEGTDSGNFASTTNQSDWTSAWVLGGGVYMPVYDRKTFVAIDVGAQYFTGGHAQYLRPGSIEDLPNAQIQITPMESDVRMLLVRIGVRIGL